MTRPDDEAPTVGAGRDVLSHPSVHRVRAAVAAHLVTTTVVVLDGPDGTDDTPRTPQQAADQLGVTAAQVVTSLVLVAHATPGSPPTPLLVLASAAHRVDTVKVAAALDLAQVETADARFVEATTGFVVGGVAPVGHPRPVRTVVDVSLARHDTVWAAAGHPDAVFRTTYDELIRMSGGLPTEVV